MIRYAYTLLFLLFFAEAIAQQDTITISAKLTESTKQISVNQQITYTNSTSQTQEKIKLLNWISAYKNRETPLLRRTLEDRKNDLYFSKTEELGSAENLQIKIGDSPYQATNSDEENIYIDLDQKLNPGKSITISLTYLLNLPKKKYTGYGSEDGKITLKYFFIVPDSFENENQDSRYFINIDENQSPGNYWKIKFGLPANFQVQSNLTETEPNVFSGKLNNDPEFQLQENNFDQLTSTIDGERIIIDFAYPLLEKDKLALEFYLPLQLSFIKNKVGVLPNKIFVTERLERSENFTGIDDI